MGKCFVDFQVTVRVWAEIQFIMTNGTEIEKSWHRCWKLEKGALLMVHTSRNIYCIWGPLAAGGLTQDTSYYKATASPKVNCIIPPSFTCIPSMLIFCIFSIRDN